MIAENGAEDAAFLLDAAFSPEDETVRSRIARSLFVLSTRGSDAFASREARFRDGRAGATPQGRGWRGRRRRGYPPPKAPRSGALAGVRSRQASAELAAATAPIAHGAMPARPFSRGKNRKERLSYRRFQCREMRRRKRSFRRAGREATPKARASARADSVLSVVENKREQTCPQTESAVFKKSG